MPYLKVLLLVIFELILPCSLPLYLVVSVAKNPSPYHLQMLLMYGIEAAPIGSADDQFIYNFHHLLLGFELTGTSTVSEWEADKAGTTHSSVRTQIPFDSSIFSVGHTI